MQLGFRTWPGPLTLTKYSYSYLVTVLNVIIIYSGLCSIFILFNFEQVLAIPAINGANLTINVTSTEYPDLEGRGNLKFGDKCESTIDCGFRWGICDASLHLCQCDTDHPITNHLDKCGKAASINETCSFKEECEATLGTTECRDNRCICMYELTPIIHKDGHVECVAINEPPPDNTYIDPAMIGVLVGMALMFVIICVVLRLFANARWRENRTIFNTPNPRLMNVSLLRDSKLLHGERRGSRGSVRGPSRQPSMASLRPHSPQSQGTRVALASRTSRVKTRPTKTDTTPRVYPAGSRRGSRGSSNASLASVRSNKSPTGSMQIQPNSNTPMLESVTVDIQASTKA